MDDAALEDDRGLREILSQARTIAVVGIKDGQSEDAYRIPRYMQERGYRIVPVNPKLDRVLGEASCASLGEIGESVDIVNLFRASEHIPVHVEEILAMSARPSVVWMQLGIQHALAASQLRAAGIRVVQDRCIMVDHRRLLDEAGE